MATLDHGVKLGPVVFQAVKVHKAQLVLLELQVTL